MYQHFTDYLVGVFPPCLFLESLKLVLYVVLAQSQLDCVTVEQLVLHHLQVNKRVKKHVLQTIVNILTKSRSLHHKWLILCKKAQKSQTS